MNAFKKIVEKAVPGIYVLPMEIGKTMMKVRCQLWGLLRALADSAI